MVARIPLIVNSSAEQIQELPSGDSLSIPGDLDVTGSITGNSVHAVQLTADGTIAANAPVTLTSAGKVKAFSTVAENLTGGSTGTFLTGSGSQAINSIEDVCWLGGQNAAVVAWKIKSSTSSLDQDLQLIAGTLSGTSISWGTRLDTGPLVSGGLSHIHLASNNNDKAILMYHESGNGHMKVRTFTVSGTTITLGTEVTLRLNSNEGNLCYLGDDGGSSYFAVAYQHSGDAEVKIIKHDGHNSMTVLATGENGVGVPNGANHDELKLIGMSHDRFLVQAGKDNESRTIHVGTRLGTTDCRIGPGYTAAELGEAGVAPFTVSGNSYDAELYEYTDETGLYDPINEKFIMWVSAGGGSKGRIRVYNIDGDTIKFQFESDFINTGVETGHYSMYPSLEVTDKGQIIVAWQDSSNHYGKRVVGSYNHERDGITWGTITTWSSEWTGTVQQVNADDGKIITVYQDTAQTGGYNISGKSKVFQTATTTLTSDNFLGFSAAGYSDGNTARISLSGSTTTKSSLTIGKKYYVQDNGTLATTRESFDVVAGKALSATSLLITEV